MRTLATVTGAALGILVLGIAPSASADMTRGAAATITLRVKALAVTVPIDAGSLGTQTNNVLGGTISGAVDTAPVDGARTAAAGLRLRRSITGLVLVLVIATLLVVRGKRRRPQSRILKQSGGAR
ncbi:MAG: hypothetical protein ACXVGQ_07700 [Mycobacteriaceae bacterium]